MKKIIALGSLVFLLSGCSLASAKNEDVGLKQSEEVRVEASIKNEVSKVTEKNTEETREGWLLYDNEHMSFTIEYPEGLSIIKEDIKINEKDTEMGVTFQEITIVMQDRWMDAGVYIVIEEDELPKKEDGGIFTLVEYKNLIDNSKRQENSTYQSEHLDINGYSFFHHTKYSDIFFILYDNYHTMIGDRYYWFRFGLVMEEFSLKQIEEQKVINREMVNSFKLK